jgi:hypothetical protein
VVEQTAPLEISIRYASTDDDLIAIHRFLLIVARPAMRCPVNAIKSLTEIIRVAKQEVAIMVMHGDVLVGTMGLIKPEWWYGDGEFLTDRWHFVLPAFTNTPTASALMDEAKAIARLADIEFIHQGKIRPPRSGVARMTPRAYEGS